MENMNLAEPDHGPPSLSASLLVTRPQKLLGRFIRISKVDGLYRQALELENEPSFIRQSLKTLNISYKLSPEDLRRIPESGPVLVIANHPFGDIDGLILCDILTSIRPDAKVMANFILAKVPELAPYLFSVDPFARENSIRSNIAPTRQALSWLNEGHCLGMFPAGEVSHLRLRRLEITDPAWSSLAARLARKTRAAVVPIFFDGRNSFLFQMAGLVHPVFRTLMLPREMTKKVEKKEIKVRIGEPIPPTRLGVFNDVKKAAEYLRWRTYLLGRPEKSGVSSFPGPKASAGEVGGASGGNTVGSLKPSAVRPGRVSREVESLPREQRLVESGEFQVFWARREQIPELIMDIGRFREKTFREVGEGSGREIDLDEFDEYYLQLFAWNAKKEELVGGYRIGLADRIVKSRGLKGLYTHTLFKFGDSFFDGAPNSLELGRSFVRKEYQRTFKGLLLLWQGIGAFVHRNPEYRYLFGPVSISQDYDLFSRRLMAGFFRRNNNEIKPAGQVKARTPFEWPMSERKKLREAISFLSDPKELSVLISDIEKDAKGLPILLVQYLKLGGRILEFNLDPNFNNCLDALIWVDLLGSDPKTLSRYMGRAEAEAFFRRHGGEEVLKNTR